MGTATFVAVREGFRGYAALYRLDPPLLPLTPEGQPWEHVVVSTTEEGGLRTSIFPANDLGQIQSFRPLVAADDAALHEEVLALAGYDVKAPSSWKADEPEPEPPDTDETVGEDIVKPVELEDPDAFWARMAKALED